MSLQQSRYSREFEEAKRAVDSGNLDQSMFLCETLLADPDLPRYYRISILILLSSVVKDWQKREELRVRAEHIWYESRALWPSGQDPTTDSILGELRNQLDILRVEQVSTAPQDYEDTLSAALAETQIEDFADILDGQLEAMADDEHTSSMNNPQNTFTRDEVKWPDSSAMSGLPSNMMFAPASTLQVSQQILNRPSVRNGQSAGSRMLHRRSGITRRSI